MRLRVVVVDHAICSDAVVVEHDTGRVRPGEFQHQLLLALIEAVVDQRQDDLRRALTGGDLHRSHQITITIKVELVQFLKRRHPEVLRLRGRFGQIQLVGQRHHLAERRMHAHREHQRLRVKRLGDAETGGGEAGRGAGLALHHLRGLPMESHRGEHTPQRRHRPIALAQEPHPQHPHPANPTTRLELHPLLAQEPARAVPSIGARPADTQKTQTGPRVEHVLDQRLPPRFPRHVLLTAQRRRGHRLLRSQIRSQRSPTTTARPQHEHRQQHQHRHHQHQLQRHRPQLATAPPAPNRPAPQRPPPQPSTIGRG